MPTHSLRGFFFFFFFPKAFSSHPQQISLLPALCTVALLPASVKLLCVPYVEAYLLPSFLSYLSPAFYAQPDCSSYFHVCCASSRLGFCMCESHCNSNVSPSSVPVPWPPALCSELLLILGRN